EMDKVVTCFSKRPEAVARLICFPWAGGGSIHYARWGRLLNHSIEVYSVRLPGRESRGKEPFFQNMQQILDEVLAVLLPELKEKPFAVFGHSFGAMTSYAFAERVKNVYNLEPVHVFLSGASAPYSETRLQAPRRSHLSDEEFLQWMISLGGTPPEILASPEALKLFMPALKADLNVVENYNDCRSYAWYSCLVLIIVSVDMASLSIKPGLRCTVPDWINSNNESSATAKHTRHQSHQTRMESRALCNETTNKTTWGEYDSNRRLSDRISDITDWKKSLEACAEEVDTEMDALTLTKEAAERALAATVLPLEVTKECLTLRDGRRGNELVSDPVEAELKKEVEVIDKAQQVLQQSIEQAFKQLCLLQEARHQLTLDLQHKVEALDIDMSCLLLTVSSPEISLKPNPTRIPPGSTTPEQWLQFSQHNIIQAKEEMQASLHLRENINITIAQVQNELETQRIATRFASRKRTHQLEQAHQELQWQIKSSQDEINELKEDILRLERDLQAKMAPLKLAHTRLEYRTRRPGVDLCRDETQFGLVEETHQLNSSILALKQKLAQAR
ncbi:Tektin-2, partial [Clarias magur]